MTSFIFFPVNGSGMGHLTRCLAYARRLRERAECIFFSLSSAMEVVEEMGLTGDYFVSPFWSANTTYDWNCELAVRFGMLLERTRPDVVVFDGTWPFQGFLAACRAYGRPLKLVWSNRGLLKKNAKTVPVDNGLFDLLIRPGELGSTPGEERTPEGVRHLHVLRCCCWMMPTSCPGLRPGNSWGCGRKDVMPCSPSGRATSRT
jgi:UDP-N-acetylglucosamine--N-acetylmuramyl-(pentapeptide) pyrophosphoryl-undecaprenol N-acetylglucosamine transferase